jgi:hypothetical protein
MILSFERQRIAASIGFPKFSGMGALNSCE